MSGPNQETPRSQDNSLDAAKQSISKKTRDLLEQVKPGITSKDLNRAIAYIRTRSGLGLEEWNKEKAAVRHELNSAIMAQTGEAGAVAQLSKKAGEKIKENAGVMGTWTAKVFAYFKSWFGSKEKGISILRKFTKGLKEDSWLKIAVGALLGEEIKGDKKTPPAGAPAGTASTTSETLEAKKARAELAKLQTEYQTSLGDRFTLKPFTKKDLEDLKTKRIQKDKISTLLTNMNKEGGILHAVASSLPEDQILEVQLSDLTIPPNKVPEVVAAIKAGKGKKSVADVRALLTAIKDPSKIDNAIANYKKKQTSAPVAPAAPPVSPAPRAEAREAVDPQKKLKEGIDLKYNQMAGLVKRACKNINGHLDIILGVNGNSLIIGGKVREGVKVNRAKVQKIRDQITGIQRTLATNLQEYTAKLALLKKVRTALLKAEKDASAKGIESMLRSEGQEAQRQILKIMADAKKGSAPLFASIKIDTAKLTV